MSSAVKLNAIIAVALVAIMVLTSQAMALARGASEATGQMVLCTDAGVVTVYTDADGKPTAQPHFCPDCVLAFADTAAAYTLTQPSVVSRAYPASRLGALLVPGNKGLIPQTRAPPVRV